MVCALIGCTNLCFETQKPLEPLKPLKPLKLLKLLKLLKPLKPLTLKIFGFGNK